MTGTTVAATRPIDDDVGLLGKNLQRSWGVDESPGFTGLLQAIDQADDELRRERRAAIESGPNT